jgi:hypothetical protein
MRDHGATRGRIRHNDFERSLADREIELVPFAGLAAHVHTVTTRCVQSPEEGFQAS